MRQNQPPHNPSYKLRQASRPTIGLFLPRIVWLQQQQWLGVVDVAREQGANLICFNGGELRSPNGFEAQGNIIFDLVDAESIDGLIIWSAAIDLYIGPAEMKEFCRRYHPLPMVSVERVLAGLPSVVVDNKQAMYEAVSHLIEVHGYRRIAFIRGPEGHVAAQERYQGYVEALAQHGLPFDPSLVPPPQRIGWQRKQQQVTGCWTNLLLLQRTERGRGVEAIVGANDSLALGVLLALQARRIRVPGDVAVVGFDDVLILYG